MHTVKPTHAIRRSITVVLLIASPLITSQGCGVELNPHLLNLGLGDNGPLTLAAGDDVVGRLLACEVTLIQGSTVLFEATVTIDYGGTGNDDHSGVNVIVPEYEYMPYGTQSNASVYMDVMMSKPGEQGQRNLYVWIWSAKRVDHIKKANHPLFKLTTTDKITLRLDEMQFERWDENADVAVYHYPYGGSAAAVYMLHYGEFDSAYYALPGAETITIGPGNVTLQVPQSLFLDADADNYWFEEGAGATPSVRWENIPSPTPNAEGLFPVLHIDGSPGAEDGEVFQLGLSAVARSR